MAAPIRTKNGSVTLAIQVISRFVMPCSTNRLKPTGGVICAISTTSTMKMPNHSGSMPAFWIVGRITPMVSTTIEMPSRKQPRIDVEDGQHEDQLRTG